MYVFTLLRVYRPPRTSSQGTSPAVKNRYMFVCARMYAEKNTRVWRRSRERWICLLPFVFPSELRQDLEEIFPPPFPISSLRSLLVAASCARSRIHGIDRRKRIGKCTRAFPFARTNGRSSAALDLDGEQSKKQKPLDRDKERLHLHVEGILPLII